VFIDIHSHACRIPGFPVHGHQYMVTDEQLIKRYDPIGVERSVLLPLYTADAIYMVQAIEDVIEMSAKHPGRFIPFCNVDPRAMTNSVDAPLGDMLRYFKDQGCRGIGEVTANLPFLHPMVQNLFKHAEEVGFPLTFHVAAQLGGMYGLYDDPGLPQLEQCLQRFPKLRFLAHSQTFWAEMAPLETVGDRYGYPSYPLKAEGAVPKLMRRYPNLLGDLSAGSGFNALNRDPDYAVKFLTEFQDKLFFGLDICAPDTRTPLVDFLLKLRTEKKISETVFQKIARENAIRLLGLES
jgi:uncharacterized protein